VQNGAVLGQNQQQSQNPREVASLHVDTRVHRRV
jgi:hypothetical protein